jgi:hypothetical protein
MSGLAQMRIFEGKLLSSQDWVEINQDWFGQALGTSFQKRSISGVVSRSSGFQPTTETHNH